MKLLPKNSIMDEMTKLSDFIKTYDQVLPEKICADIISLFDSNKNYQSRVNNNKRPNFTEMNFTANLDKLDASAGQFHSALLDSFRKVKVEYFQTVISKAFDGTSFVPDRHGWEQFRIKKYNKSGDQFKEHVDIGDTSSSKRYLAFLLYLNDNFSGGETEFTTCGLTIQPKTGTVVVFPPTWNFPHQGNKVTSGEKYILSTYLNYL